MNGNAGHGVQVVDVTASHDYKLNEDALNVLLSDAVRALPVAVVSVAGAFRGGKSFLLDFFLRYLNATDADRRSGAWLGEDDEPLVGFHWRTGYARNTIGIHIWSRPFPMTLSSGEKVAVVLMDTQGTFDNESTMRDSTTIFALSTLLSSVQIYNLSGNLKGDDLQHLQLFTEYARLVANDAKPFQHLKFLIRDWQHIGDLPYGANGGKRLLDRVLEVTQDQPAQQQELRRHLRSCFQVLDCFLMAHPGFKVCEKDFKGRVADLRTEFRECLLELVPLLFEPSRLVPKRINDQLLTAQEFALYFKTYINTFNSDTLPTPATILQATTEAGLLLATEAARAQYASAIEAGTGDRLLPTAAVYRLHSQALTAARDLFTSRKIMGNRQKIDEALMQLIQELDGHLRDFASVNEAKMSKASSAAVEAYEARMLGDVPEGRLCAAPAALEAAHRAAAAAVADAFKEQLHADGDDKETQQLLKDLKTRYTQIVQFNELNNNAYVSDALDEYVKEMDKCTNGGQPCMSGPELQAKHRLAHEAATEFLKRKRNCYTDSSSSARDQYFDRLDKDIKVQYEKFTQINKTNNESVVVAVVASYKDRMSKLFGPNMKCLPPGKFEEDEEKVREKALEMYRSRRTVGAGESHDSCLEEIEEAMNEHYNQVLETNKELNKAGVEAAVSEYRTVMDAKTEGLPTLLRPLAAVLLPVRLLQLWIELNGYHETAKKTAIQKFKSHRRNGKVEDDDKYYDRLINKINSQYDHYKNPFVLIARDLGIDLQH